jgi:hypothetical protein
VRRLGGTVAPDDLWWPRPPEHSRGQGHEGPTPCGGLPIGTHVFTAMARNGAGLRWTAVTIDNGDDAKDALDRLTIPQDVLDRIAPTACRDPRSSSRTSR